MHTASSQQKRAADLAFVHSMKVSELEYQIKLIEDNPPTPFTKQKIRELRQQIKRFKGDNLI